MAQIVRGTLVTGARTWIRYTFWLEQEVSVVGHIPPIRIGGTITPDIMATMCCPPRMMAVMMPKC